MLVASVAINYIDRGNLSVAATRIADQFGIDEARVGVLHSSFFWTYASFMIIAGWLIDRFSVYWVFAGGYFLWSAATAATGLAHGYWMIFAFRLILGAGESVAYPSYSKLIARGFEERQRGLANALIDLGCKAGPALGLLIGGAVLTHYRWQVLFIGIGAISMLWLIPWTFVARHATRPTPNSAAEPEIGPSWLEILAQRSAWGTFLGLFCLNYVWYFMLTWLPWYMERARGYSKDQLALVQSLPFWAVGLSSLLCGHLSDYCIARGFGSPAKIRKIFMVGGLLCSTLMLPAGLIDSRRVALGFLIAACICFGACSSHIWLVTQRLAGPLAAGRWTGIQNGIGNLAGIVAPIVTGWIVKSTGKFYLAFVVVTAILVIGAASYAFIVRTIDPVIWKPARAKAVVPSAIKGALVNPAEPAID
jgi:MFS family permease